MKVTIQELHNELNYQVHQLDVQNNFINNLII